MLAVDTRWSQPIICGFDESAESRDMKARYTTFERLSWIDNTREMATYKSWQNDENITFFLSWKTDGIRCIDTFASWTFHCALLGFICKDLRRSKKNGLVTSGNSPVVCCFHRAIYNSDEVAKELSPELVDVARLQYALFKARDSSPVLGDFTDHTTIASLSTYSYPFYTLTGGSHKEMKV